MTLRNLAFAIVAILVLGWHVGRDGLAATYSDPISHVRAQDETVYVNSAMTMQRDGDWLTPKMMDRLFLFKPPLLMWLTAGSMKLFGSSLMAIRLPAVLAGAAGAVGVLAWVAHARGALGPGVLAFALLLASPFWQTFSRLCYTDIFGATGCILSLVFVAFDPGLERRSTRFAFGFFAAVAVLAKSVVGGIPVLALLLFRPPVRRLMEGVGWLALFAAPWHVYQLVVHPQWFWADYVQVQLLGIGVQAAKNRAWSDLPIFYYLQRLGQLDPVLAISAIAAAVALPFRRQNAALRLPLCWAAVVLLALCAFQAKNLPYVIFLLPALCVVAGVLVPPRAAWIAVPLALLLRLPFAPAPAPVIPGAEAMRHYASLQRRHELISVQPDDEFYSATLALQSVRYVFLDPEGWVARFVPHYVPLGITLTADEFVRLPELEAGYRERLRSWGLDSSAPIGRAIVLRDPTELNAILAARPSADFYVPADWIRETPANHRVVPYGSGRVFLLAFR